MIRINLLPVREARRQADLRNQGILLGLAVLAAVLLCLPIQIYQARKAARLKAEIVQVNAELTELQVVRDKVAEFTREQEEIEKKLSVISSLERSRSGPVRIMDEVASRIPKRMWLTSLSMEDGELRMEGVSLDAEIVAAFLTSLSESRYIRNVELEETKLEETEGLKLNTFKLRSLYEYPPQPGVDAPIVAQK
ncbi:MAG: PilN domain-containing protein [Myxococcota bacterium]